MTLHFRVIFNNLDFLLEGLKMTFLISVFSLIIGFFIGLVVAFMRISKKKLFSSIAIAYVEFFRNTPFLVQLFFFYFGLPELGITTEPVTTAIIALGINNAAYNSEIIRAGIISINKGLIEGAESLGFTKFQIVRLIIIPNALRVTFKPLGSNFINLILTTSVAVSITANELMSNAMTLSSNTFRPFEIYLTILVLYCVLTFSLSGLIHLVDRKFISKGIS